MSISLILPTRGRPNNLKRLKESVLHTARNEIEISLYIDDDDQPSLDMANQLDMKITVGPRIVLSKMWNKAYEKTTGDILMHCGDDIIFRTMNWDVLIEHTFAQYPDKILFVHGQDGFWGSQFGTHGFIHRNWVNTVGYFVPPYFSCDYNDTWLNEVANKLGRRVYLDTIYTEHMHYVFGKAEKDLTHQEREARGKQDNVTTLYESFAFQREGDYAKLAKFIAEYKP